MCWTDDDKIVLTSLSEAILGHLVLDFARGTFWKEFNKQNLRIGIINSIKIRLKNVQRVIGSI